MEGKNRFKGLDLVDRVPEELWTEFCNIVSEAVTKTIPEEKKYKNATMEYYSAIKKNLFESVLMRWMKLEPIIQSEVSQKDKDHYSIITHIYGI